MQFNKKSFLTALRHVGRVATKNTVLPVLSCVYLTDKLLKGSNIQTTIEVDIESVVELGATFTPVVVDYKKLLDAVTALPDSLISINSNGTTVVISGAKGTITLIGEKAEDFPQAKHEPGEPVSMPFSEFIEIAKFMPDFCLYGDGATMRPQMSGVFFNGKAFVATDAMVLMERELAEPVESRPIIFPTEVIDAAVIAFSSVKPEQKITIDGNLIETPAARIYFQAIDARYPDYKAILPSNLPEHNSFKFSKEKALEAIGIVTVGADETSRTGVIEINGNSIKLKSKDPNIHNEATADLAEGVTFVGSAPEFPYRLGINLRFFSTVLNAIPDDEITFNFIAPSRAYVLTTDNMRGVALVLPVLVGHA